MAGPVRIIAAPYTVYLATVGTAFPTLEEAPSTAWTKLGTSGAKDYSEAGVTVTHSQTLGSFTGAGSTLTRRVWRTDESAQFALDLADMTPKQYALIMDNVAVTTVTGASGEENFQLERGIEVHGYALLARGPSALNGAAGKESQYEVTLCYQAGNPAPKFAIKGGPALLSCQFTAMEGEADGFVKLRVHS